jgi:Phycobilisome degradation protein nblA
MDLAKLELSLSLEQEFSLRQSKTIIARLDQAQAQEFLIEVLQQLMIKDNAIRSLMRSNLGLDV